MKKIMLYVIISMLLLTVSGVYADNIELIYTEKTVCGTSTIEWNQLKPNVNYNVTLNTLLGTEVELIVNETMNIENVTYNFNQVPQGYYKLQICTCAGAGTESQIVYEMLIDNNCFVSTEPSEQGMHVGVLIFISVLIIVCIILAFKYQMVSFGVLAGVLMFITSALMFNPIYYNVCEASVTELNHYCGQQPVNIPFWFKFTLQTLLILISLGVIMESIYRPQRAKRNSEVRY
jgi:hypothetical protein